MCAYLGGYLIRRLTAGDENAIRPEVISLWTYDCADNKGPISKSKGVFSGL